MTNIILREDSTPNFCDKEGKPYLVRCPQCSNENYAFAVSTGICAWCMYDLEQDKIINLPGKKIEFNEN